jgi:hypothetical protein
MPSDYQILRAEKPDDNAWSVIGRDNKSASNLFDG